MRIRWAPESWPPCIKRGVTLRAVENALVLALTPRLMHNGEVPPLGTTGSWAYFVPVIEGMLESRRGKTS